MVKGPSDRVTQRLRGSKWIVMATADMHKLRIGARKLFDEPIALAQPDE